MYTSKQQGQWLPSPPPLPTKTHYLLAVWYLLFFFNYSETIINNCHIKPVTNLAGVQTVDHLHIRNLGVKIYYLFHLSASIYSIYTIMDSIFLSTSTGPFHSGAYQYYPKSVFIFPISNWIPYAIVGWLEGGKLPLLCPLDISIFNQLSIQCIFNSSAVASNNLLSHPHFTGVSFGC